MQHLKSLNTNLPVDGRFNAAVLKMADKIVGHYIVSDNAPSTYKALKAHLDAGNTMVVAAEGSDYTIFGSAEVNWAFRAWHDWTHWHHKCDFSLIGETMAGLHQMLAILQEYGANDVTYRWIKLLEAEVIGQRRYYEKYREYINDQKAFALAYVKDTERTLSTKW